MATERVTLDDIDSKLRTLQGDARARIDDKKQPVLAGVGVLALVLLILMYLLGRRSGKKRTTFVDIRRV